MFSRKHSKTILVALAVTTIGLLAGGLAMNSLLAAPAGTTMHVEAVNINFSNVGGPNRLASAYVFVRDELGNPVNGAVVTGNWSGCFRQTGDSGTTKTFFNTDGTIDVDGVAQIDADKARSCWGNPTKCSFIFTVTNITKTGLIYDASKNLTSSGSTQCR